MLFRYTEIETSESKKLQNAVVVRKCSTVRLCLYPVLAALLIAAGVLFLILQPIGQYLATAIILFVLSLVPLFYFLDALFFRLMIGTGKIVLTRLLSKECAYAYTDVSWCFQTPDKKRSALLIYKKDQTVARILPGAKHYGAVLSLRHKGNLSGAEKELLRRLSDRTDGQS